MFALNFRHGVKAMALLLSVLLMTSCVTISPLGPQPVKSPNDNYSYRLLTLDNSLEVLLISDPEAPKAAAALDILVGSGDNPRGRAGLAHFLEHMLFLAPKNTLMRLNTDTLLLSMEAVAMPIPALRIRTTFLTSTALICRWHLTALLSFLLRLALMRNMSSAKKTRLRRNIKWG